MAGQGKTTLQLPVQTSVYDANDMFVFVYGADTANAANSIAQTSIISYQNLFSANVQQTDPANSTSLSISQGSVFYSNSYGYVAIANNTLMRWPISSF